MSLQNTDNPGIVTFFLKLTVYQECIDSAEVKYRKVKFEDTFYPGNSRIFFS